MNSNKICPNCDEENPAEAVMCWACYTPLGEPGEAPHFSSMEEERQRHERESRLGAFKTQTVYWLQMALLLGAVANWIASGYQPRRKGALIASGAACLSGFVGWVLWESRIHEQSRYRSEADEEPVRRIADTILLYAVKDGASQIRLRSGVGIQVSYLINGEWHEQMKIPAYVWGDLRMLWKAESQNWQNSVRLANGSTTTQFIPHFEQEYPLQVLTLTPST